MEPLEFLAAVLPSPGHGQYCAAELSSKKKQHLFAEDLSEFSEPIERWLKNKNDIYFALATFAESGSRTADNARYIKSLFIDMDNYASKKEAGTALSAFLETTGLDALGTPWVVASGGGLHCYWAFSTAVTVSTWKPVAESLKRLCKQESLNIDNTVTADAARVLRVPGTFNFKAKYETPRPVRILTEGTEIDFDAFAGRLLELVGEVPVTMRSLDLPGQRPVNATKTGVQLMANTVVQFKEIVQKTKRGEGCLQLAHYVENATDEGMEPLWRGWLSQAKYCADGERAAIWLTKMHPYDEGRMHSKLSEIKGPYPCLKFESENPGLCEKCPHFGKITNPLALGRELVVDDSEKEIVLPPDETDPEAPPVTVLRPTPPKGYSYGQSGGVFCNRIVEEADGTKRKQQVMILPYDMFVVDLLNKDGEHTVHMLANRPGKPVDILFPQRYAVSKDEMTKKLAEQNILASFGAGNDKNLFDYVRACVEEASVNKQAIRVPSQYGWQEDGSIVYSGRVFSPDGRVMNVPMPDLENLNRATRSVGTLENWRKFPQLLIRRKLYDMLAMLCVGFGSPLMRFTQMPALTFHAGSTESGTGKSLTLSAVASIMGHPSKYRTGKSTSAVTMQQRCGNLNSFAFLSDEITHKSRQDMEWFPGLIFDLAEGQGKEKSEVHVNRERLNNVSWSLLAFLTSNVHMQDYMSGSRQFSSNGELFRMLEWTPNVALEWTEAETDVIKLLHSNYGVAGEQYIRWLAQNAETAKRITTESVELLKRIWRMSGDERFWAAGCGAIVAGATMASSRYANVCDLPVDRLIESLKKLVDKARKVVKLGVRNAEDVLNAFVREHYGQFVVIKESEKGKLLAAFGDGKTVDETITRSKVMGRVEHDIAIKGSIEFFIEEHVIKSHCVAMSFGYEDFKKQMSVQEGYTIKFMRKDMMSKTRGPQMRVNSIAISRRKAAEEDAEELPVGQS